MTSFARDTNIGYPETEEDIIKTEIQNLSKVTESVNISNTNLEDATDELRLIRTGMGLLLDEEVEEVI